MRAAEPEKNQYMDAKRQDMPHAANPMRLRTLDMRSVHKELLATNPTAAMNTPNQIGNAEQWKRSRYRKQPTRHPGEILR